jgi:hypothetical protein
MTDPSQALRKAIHAQLSADAPLLALLGPGRIHDEVPRGREPPYVVIGEGQLRDWSTTLYRGHEHLMLLAAWSKEGGAKEAYAIADALLAALEGLGPALDGHHLVNLVGLATDVKREADRRLVKATIRVRAVTEVA